MAHRTLIAPRGFLSPSHSWKPSFQAPWMTYRSAPTTYTSMLLPAQTPNQLPTTPVDCNVHVAPLSVDRSTALPRAATKTSPLLSPQIAPRGSVRLLYWATHVTP